MGPFSDSSIKMPYDTTKTKVIFEGNSLVYGIGSTAGSTLPQQLQALPPMNGATLTNLAVSGSTFNNTNSMTARGASVDALYEDGKSHVLLIWEGTNTIWFNDVTGTQTGQQCADYIAARTTAMPGLKVILLTTLPRYSVDGSSVYGSDLVSGNNTLLDYDNYIKRNYREMGAHAVVDVRAHGVFVASGTNFMRLSMRPYVYDSTHLNNWGYGLIAQYCATALRHLPKR